MSHFITSKANLNTIPDQDNNPVNLWSYNFYWLIATVGTTEHRSYFADVQIYLPASLSEQEVDDALNSYAVEQIAGRQAAIMYGTVPTE